MAKLLPLFSAAVAAAIGLSGMAQCPAGTTAVTVYFSDFEADDGGLVAPPLSDWEHGEIPLVITGSTCSGTPEDPGGAYSGINGWATKLDDCHSNQSPSGFITMDLEIDMSDPDYVSAQLSLAHWFDVFTDWDYLVITANGTEVYRNDTTEFSNGWMTLTADLTPFVGQASVTLSFKLWATTVVNYTGWYIDDVLVTACATGSTIGIAEVDGAGFRVWPVPATEVLHVEPSTAMGAVLEWTLYDVTGRQLASGSPVSSAPFSLDVARFKGVNVLDLRTANGHYHKRLLVQ